MSITLFAVSDRGLAHLSEDCDRQILPDLTNQLEATCVVTDPNFLILRTLVAYALPLIGCLVITVLQVRCLRQLKFLPPELSLAMNFNPVIQRDITLETLAPLIEESRQNHCCTFERFYQCPGHGKTVYNPKAVISGGSCDSEPENRIAGTTEKQWLQMYRGEQLAVAINMVSSTVAVGVWSPIILSSLIYGLCHSSESLRPVKSPLYQIPGIDLSKYHPSRCIIQVAASGIADFRWWVYASTGLLLPVALLIMDKSLRRACWRSLSLKIISVNGRWNATM